MTKQRVTVELDVPDGYEATGEWRRAGKDERTLLFWHDGSPMLLRGETAGPGFILRRKLPETVMVELPRGVVQIWAGADNSALAKACAAALAKEAAHADNR